MRTLVPAMLAVFAACGARASGAGSVAAGGPSAPSGEHAPEGAMMMSASQMATDAESRFGPLETGADYLHYRRLTKKPFLSLVHGNRWVHVYVNEIGADAYLRGTEVPVGTIIVKASWLDDDGAPSLVAGPVYVMEKRAPGYAPAHGDWYYAIRWEAPPPADARKYGGPIYWRGASPRVAFCYKCHDAYDHSLGGLTPSSVLPR